MPCDHEVPRALAAVGLPQPTEGPRIDVDVENRVDSVIERRAGDGDASVRPGAVVDGPFSERMVRCPHADHDVCQGRPELRHRFEDRDRIPHPRFLRELGPQSLVHQPSSDLVARVVDAHQADPDHPRHRRQVVVVLRVDAGLALLLHLPDGGIGRLLGDAMTRQDTRVFRKHLRQTEDRASSRRMVGDDEIVPLLFREEEVRRIHIDAEQHLSHVARRHVDRRIRGNFRLIRQVEGEGEDLLAVHRAPAPVS